MYADSLTLFMWSFRVAIPWDGGTDDLKDKVSLSLSEQRQNPVELIEGTRPAMHHHERQNLLSSTLDRLHMDEVHIQT